MSSSTRKLRQFMAENEIKDNDLIMIFRTNNPKRLGDICNLDKDRIIEILEGESPTFLESMWIMESIGGSISDIWG